MSILNNAIEAIQIGVEDYQQDDNRRSLSAVRNICAGILLLYKEKLVRLSPDHDKDLLVKKDIKPIKNTDGTISFKSTGNKTVDVHGIKERFLSLKIDVDWKRFEEINQLRNDIEHYYTSKSPDAVKEIVAKSFILIRNFLAAHLEEDPREILGDDCWAALLEVVEVYEAEHLECKTSLGNIDWKYATITEALDELRCPNCHSSLIKAPYDDKHPNINLLCASCGSDFSFLDVVEKIIEDHFEYESYSLMKDGGDPSYGHCLNCDRETFIVSEKSCIACDAELEYQNCEWCEDTLGIDDQILEGKCSYCHYKWEKIEDE